ncbi:MAG: gliding motility-associated C-terminal domain-containing protein [Lutibacter sp.]
MRLFVLNIIFSLISFLAIAQSGFHNFGNIQIHDNGEIGFHTDEVVNDGMFDNNKGLAGFYSNNNITIKGSNEMVFADVDIDIMNNLDLKTSLGVSNDLSFINGYVLTPRNVTNISLDFISYDVYSGEGDFNHVNGYVQSVNNKEEFVCPIGDGTEIRPLIISGQSPVSKYYAAYFRENPNYASTFSTGFSTFKKSKLLGYISTTEFWDFNGTQEAEVTLTWNANSHIENITNNVENLRVVGWNKSREEWTDLGGENVMGDLTSGKVKSKKFIPNDYEIITIGADLRAVLSESTFTTHNYGFSPNGDGVHDTFQIDGILLRPNNTLRIYNRWGALVYKKDHYKNTWNGTSDNGLTIKKKEGLPVGVYFYTLDLHDENKQWKGYIYLNR